MNTTGSCRPGGQQTAAQLDARHACQVDVQDEAQRVVGNPALQKLFRAREGGGRVVARTQETLDGLAHRRVIVNDGNQSEVGLHGQSITRSEWKAA